MKAEPVIQTALESGVTCDALLVIPALRAEVAAFESCV